MTHYEIYHMTTMAMWNITATHDTMRNVALAHDAMGNVALVYDVYVIYSFWP